MKVENEISVFPEIPESHNMLIFDTFPFFYKKVKNKAQEKKHDI